jgi:hypothetical protein
MSALVVAMAVAIALLAVLVAGLLRSHAEILRALHDLGAGLGDPSLPAAPGGRTAPVQADARDVSGETPTGEVISVAVTGRDQLTLLAFLSTGCLTCRRFWDAFADADLAVPGRARLVVVTKGAEAESPSALQALAPKWAPTILSTEAWEQYSVPGAPYMVLVDGNTGRIVGEGTGGSWDQVQSLLRQALADAGLAAGRRGRSTERRSGPQREARADRELRAAGIEPGHPSLYPGASSASPHESE